jgi:tetrahydromethanopterin S-methyltransferase subunit G
MTTLLEHICPKAGIAAKPSVSLPSKVCIMSEPDLTDLLRLLRRIDDKVENLEGEIRELKTRVIRIENDVEKVQGHLDQHTNRLEERLGRIDRRLGIVETDL